MAKVRVPTRKVVKREIKNVFGKSVPIPEGLVTNEDIRQKFIYELNKTSFIPSSAMSNIKRLVDNQQIIPVNIESSGAVKRIYQSIKRNSRIPFSYYDGVLGFYSGFTNRIYLLLDNIAKYRGNSEDSAKVLIHELQHMQCHNFPSEFFFLHKDLFTKFYATLFKTACDMYSSNNIKIDSHNVMIFAKYLIYMFDDLIANPSFYISKNDIASYAMKAYGTMVGNNEDDLTDDDKDVAWQIANILANSGFSIIFGKFFDNAQNDSKSIERFSYFAIHNTYKKIGLDPKKLASFFGQELVYASEIIALLIGVRTDPSLFLLLGRL